MKSSRRIRLSKFLSYVLRHHPGKIGLTPDKGGWVEVDALLEGCRKHGVVISREELEEIVKTNDKQRFSFDADGQRIRANQGHSIPVDLDYPPVPPPEFLYHGTSRRYLDSIRRSGLQKMQRHHVHLSPDRQTALKVGQRHGQVVILTVKAKEMYADGFEFYLSSNGVWLVEEVPPQYLNFPSD
ncbi:MAG: RNA 2'-phosphotransferase [Calditrichaeota bacterium]|nr:MAG: RNA 2'-phosphotransferase [Calditrichota bacterium]